MHKKSKTIKILLMIVIMTIILSISKSVFGFSFSASLPEPYYYSDYLFCRNHANSYSIKNVPGMDKSTRTLEYEKVGEQELEQSIAFAVYTAAQTGNWSPEQIQQVIWSSGQFGDLSSFIQMLVNYTGNTTSAISPDVLEARSNQYAQFYYGILNGGKNIELTTESKNSKVLVDQTNQTYTVGPYKVDLKIGELADSVKDAKTILYNELAGINAEKYPNTPSFATFDVTGLEGDNIIFLDKSGKEIGFPNWGEDFYIRYNPTNGITTINPKITINYIKNVTGKAILYSCKKATVKGKITNIYINIDDFDPSDFVSTGSLKCEGNLASNVELKVTKYNITNTVKVDEGPIYDENGKIKGYKYHRTYVTEFEYEAEATTPEIFQETMEITPFRIKYYHKLTGKDGFEIYIDEDEYEEYEEEQYADVLAQPEFDETTADLGVKDISMELGGNVWVDLPGVKLGDFTGIRGEEDSTFAGMQVSLYDENNNLIATTMTNNEGKYHFDKLDPLKKYYVKFTFNGQIYQSTYYKSNLTGGYSNAVDEARDSFNSKFGSIASTPKNYKVGNEWHKSYAFYSKLAREDGEYIAYEDGALT